MILTQLFQRVCASNVQWSFGSDVQWNRGCFRPLSALRPDWLSNFSVRVELIFQCPWWSIIWNRGYFWNWDFQSLSIGRWTSQIMWEYVRLYGVTVYGILMGSKPVCWMATIQQTACLFVIMWDTAKKHVEMRGDNQVKHQKIASQRPMFTMVFVVQIRWIDMTFAVNKGNISSWDMLG